MYNDLETRIKNKELTLDITIEENRAISIARLTFTKIERFVSNNRQGTTSLLRNYKLKFKNYEFSEPPITEIFQTSVDDCAKKCNELVGRECKLFSFCYLSGDCMLNRALGGDELNISAVVESRNCDIYESKFKRIIGIIF